jgi:hypothetical protein
VQVECKWCDRLRKDNFKHKVYTVRNLGKKHHSPPYNIFYDSPWGLHPNDTFSRTPKWESQNWDSCCLELWTLISLSKQACLDCTRKISYNVQKDLFNGVLHAPIKYHLIPSLRGFVVGSQIFNLILDPSFDHNLCILGLNE